MFLKKTLTKAGLLKERAHIASVLTADLGRSPTGNKLDQLTAHLLKFKNFETAEATTRNSDKALIDTYIDIACETLEISRTSEIDNAVWEGIEASNQKSKENDTLGFDPSEKSSIHRISCFVLYHHISETFNPINKTGFTHPRIIHPDSKDLLDELIYSASIKFTDYFFYKTVENSVQQWSQISSYWIQERRFNSINKELARLTCFTARGLEKIFANHDIGKSISFDIESRLVKAEEYFSPILSVRFEDIKDLEAYWLAKAEKEISKSLSSANIDFSFYPELRDSKLIVDVKVKLLFSGSGDSEYTTFVHEVELLKSKDGLSLTHQGYLKSDPTFEYDDNNPPSMLKKPMADYYYAYGVIKSAIENVKSKMS